MKRALLWIPAAMICAFIVAVWAVSVLVAIGIWLSQWNRRRIVCAWCNRIIKIGGPRSFFPGARLSHGICKPCSDQERKRSHVPRRRATVPTIRTRDLEIRAVRAQQREVLALMRCSSAWCGRFLFFALITLECNCERAAPARHVYRPQPHRAITVSYSSDPDVPHLEVTP